MYILNVIETLTTRFERSKPEDNIYPSYSVSSQAENDHGIVSDRSKVLANDGHRAAQPKSNSCAQCKKSLLYIVFNHVLYFNIGISCIPSKNVFRVWQFDVWLFIRDECAHRCIDQPVAHTSYFQID